ncbi:MAG: HEAT repeat domain-containing protein [Patescibacteria group bacterium]|nr:HEAT repeat domain-containing protein [Patescibacteria group bacterium]
MPKTISRKTTEKPRERLERVWREVAGGGLSVLDEATLSEAELRNIAERIKRTAAFGSVFLMLDSLPRYGRNYDWNVGSILQHFEASLVLDALKHVGDLRGHYNSIGLAWVLGEFRTNDRFAAEYLYEVIRIATDADAWWRAAFSLEQMGFEDAVNLLKRSLKPSSLETLERQLEKLHDKRALIAVLVLSDSQSIRTVVYPKVKGLLMKSKDTATIIGCCWLIGRLGLIDEDILEKLEALMKADDYELRYYTFFALQRNANERLRPLLELAVADSDPLIRKMAVRGLVSVGSHESLNLLESALFAEKEALVIAEMTKAIYQLRNPTDRDRLLTEHQSAKNENGLITDKSDRWYGDPYIYGRFADAEDPENICFDLVRKRLGKRKIRNPVDLATGNGRTAWQIMDKLKFDGKLFAVDISKDMCDCISRRLSRERRYTNPIEVVQSSIADFGRNARAKSSFVVSSFGFPSCGANSAASRAELEAVHNLLADDGVFVTIGWDETYNDELSEMWFRFIPDDIEAKDFEEWRVKRAEATEGARNCGLTWFKRGLVVPLQFSTVKEAAAVMGALFGRDAASFAVRRNKSEWTVSMGITFDTKSSLTRILKQK